MAADTPDPKALEATQKAATDLMGVINNLSKALGVSAEQISKIAGVGKEAFGKLTDAGEKVNLVFNENKELIATFNTELQGLSNETESLIRDAKSLASVKWVNVKAINQADQAVTKLKGDIAAVQAGMKKGMSDKQLKAATQELDRLNGEMEKQKYLLERSPWAASFTDAEDGMKGLGSVIHGVSSKSFGGLANAAKAGGKQAQGLVDKAQGLSQIGGIGNKIQAVLLKGIGGALGSLSKLMAGPFGIAAIVTKAIWDIGMAADKFVKNANKRFAQVRGPDIMTSDVKGQFKKFNDELYSTAKNLQVGLNAEQVGEFVQALTGAGVHIQRLSTGFSNYRDAVYVAAKASKNLGLEMPDIGMKMGKLMNELRMNIGDIDKLFTNVAFDAKKAGLSTEEFWNAIENATVSLGFYGNFIQNASKQMTKFTKTQVMGVKDSASMVEELNQSFAKMDNTQRAAFAGLIQHTNGGAKALKDMFSMKGAEFEKKAKALSVEIQMKQEKYKKDPSPDLLADIKRLQEEQAADTEKSLRAQEAIKSGNAVDMAPYMQMLSDNSHELLGILVKGRVGSWTKLTGRNVWLAEEIAKATGMSADLIMKSAAMAKQIDARQSSALESIGDQLGDMKPDVTEENLSAMGKALDGYASTIETATDQDAVNKMGQDLAAQLKKANVISEDEVDNFVEMLSVDKKAGKTMAQKMGALLIASKKGGKVDKDGIKKQIAAIQQFRKDSNLADTALEKNNDLFGMTQGDMAKAADNTFKKVVDQTLSFEEMAEIGKDEIKWRGASLGYAQKLNEGVFGIFKMLAKRFGEVIPMNEQQKTAQEALKLQNKGLALDEKGNVTAASQRDLMIKSVLEQKKQAAEISKLDAVKNALDEMSTVVAAGGNASEAIDKRIAAMNTQIEANNKTIKDAKNQGDPQIVELKKQTQEMTAKMEEVKKLQQSEAYKAGKAGGGTSELSTVLKDMRKAVENDTSLSAEQAQKQYEILDDAKKTNDDLLAIQEGNEEKMSKQAKDEYKLAKKSGKVSLLIAKKQEEVKKAQKEIVGNGLDTLSKENKNSQDTANKSLTKAKENIKNLESLNESNAGVEENTMDLAMETPAGQQRLAEKLVAATEAQGGDILKGAQQIGLKGAGLKRIMGEVKKGLYDKDATEAQKDLVKTIEKIKPEGKAWGKTDSGSDFMGDLGQTVKRLKEADTKAASAAANEKAGTAAAGTKKEANLRTPMMVTTPGYVKMDPGEGLMPKGYNKIGLQTIKEPPGAGGAGGGGAKNITISVNATEKDLAQRIANEVPWVLYKEQLTGAG